jgi:hypothetical protein
MSKVNQHRLALRRGRAIVSSRSAWLLVLHGLVVSLGVEGDRKVCRTFAIVRYPDQIDPLFAAEHELILRGGSIGSVFATRGWTIEKLHGYYGMLDAGATVAALMDIAPRAQLAVHVYALDVAKGSARFRYATIAEIHHPDYLRADDLPRIYGPAAHAPDDASAEILEIAASKLH